MTEEEEDDEGGGRDEGMALDCGGQQQVGRGCICLYFLPHFSSPDTEGLFSEVSWHYSSGDIDMSVCKCVCVCPEV